MSDFLQQLRRVSVERTAVWGNGAMPDPLWRATELGGEVGEALNEVKKLVREQRGERGSRTTVEKLAEELADVIICTDLLAATYGIDLHEAVVHKFNATSDKVGLPHKLTLEAPTHG